jgi:rare lipoprotein A
VLLLLAASACGGGGGRPRQPSGAQHFFVGWEQRGLASWYGGGHHRGPTASGERFDKFALTAAHPRLPMNARVRVRSQRNGNEVVVRINDRGPFSGRRVIDLSEAAARKLDMIDAGVVPVELTVIALPR